MDYIPMAIWSNFISGDYISPGPSGTLLDGLLRPVFLFRSEYAEWLSKKFGETAKPQEGSLYLAASSPSSRTVDDVNDAITALWGERPPAKLAAKERNYRIVKWLENAGRGTASDATIRRGLVIRRDRRN
jgi:hypothetical protein